MLKILQRPIAAACVTSMLLCVVSGCTRATIETAGQRKENIQNNEPVKLTWFSFDHNRVLKDNDPAILELEKKTNTKLEFVLVPSTEQKAKLNMLVASNSLPDITKIEGYDIFQYIPQGVFLELNSYIEKYGRSIKKAVPKEAWDGISSEGKYYGVPKISMRGKYNMYIRQDWLENLGLKAPTNLDELADVLRKFTFNDPDKNGQNDTYGLGSEGAAGGDNPTLSLQAIFGAYGIIPKYYYLKEGKFYASIISPEYRQALAYIKNLYMEKTIDPDLFIMKNDQARQKLVQGKAGVFMGWWSIPQQVLFEQFKMEQVNPKAKWQVIDEIKGSSGQYGFSSPSIISAVNCISKSSKNVEAAIKVIDYLYSDEGAILGIAGVKGLDYITTPDGKFDKATEQGLNGVADKTMGLLSQLVLNPVMDDEINKKRNPSYKYFIDSAENAKLYKNVFEGYSTQEFQRLGSDLNKFENDWLIKFIAGKEPIEKFNEYVIQWKAKGGKQIMDSFIAEYNKRNGTQYTAGN